MPSSPPAPSVMPPMKRVRTISSLVGGISCIILSRTACRCAFISMPSPARAGLCSDSLRPNSEPSGIAGLEGPVVPSRMTGALKFMLGMFGGG